MTLIQARDIMVHPVCLSSGPCIVPRPAAESGEEALFVPVCLSGLLSCRDRINYYYHEILRLYHIASPASAPSLSLLARSSPWSLSIMGQTTP